MNNIPNRERVDHFIHEVNLITVKRRDIWRKRYAALSDAIRLAKQDAACARSIRNQRAAQMSLLVLGQAANEMMIERLHIRSLLIQSAHPWV